MPAEVELKLELDPEDARSLSRHALFKNADRKSQHELSVYYDTASGKLRKNGLTLRVRSTPQGFVQTVKSMEPGAGLFFRGEWETSVRSIEPNAQELERTPVGKFGARKLHPVVRSAVERTTWRSESSGTLLEFAFDDGELSADGRGAPVCEFEIELLRGEPAKAFEAARSLAEAVPVRIGVLSKAERGFALADDTLAMPTKAAPVPVHRDMTVAEGFAAIAQSCIRHFRLNEPLVVNGRHPLALHQARVAMRRLRSALSLFRPAVMDAEFPELREELRWFTGHLGEARNLDVYLERDLPEGHKNALKQDREWAYSNVIATLESKRFRLLMIDLVRWSSLGRWRSGEKAERPLSNFAGRRVDRLWQKLSAHADLRAMDDEGRHEVRIEIKKLRYALEFLQALHVHVGRKQKQFLRGLEATQESLGKLNDLATAHAFFGALSHDAPDPSQEPKLISQAERRFRRVKKMGPYWAKHDSAKRQRIAKR